MAPVTTKAPVPLLMRKPVPVTAPVREVSALPVPVVTVPPLRRSVPLLVSVSRVSRPPTESVAPEAIV